MSLEAQNPNDLFVFQGNFQFDPLLVDPLLRGQSETRHQLVHFAVRKAQIHVGGQQRRRDHKRGLGRERRKSSNHELEFSGKIPLVATRFGQRILFNLLRISLGVSFGTARVAQEIREA